MTEEQQQPEPGPPGPPELSPAPGSRGPRHRRSGQPHLTGDLPTMLESGPSFATAMRGYDRLQVDNYVEWAENEMRAAQRVITELVDRLAANEGELRHSRQVMARSAEDRELVVLADRVAGLLRLAAQEAAASAELTAHDAGQAEDVVANAREEAELVLRRARRMEARAATRLQEAERRLGEARAEEERTRTRVQQMLHAAADEQERIEVAAAARRTQLERDLQDLQQRRQRAQHLVGQLAHQLDTALAALGDEPAGFVFSANRALSA
jgi:colicin import membrane protein